MHIRGRSKVERWDGDIPETQRGESLDEALGPRPGVLEHQTFPCETLPWLRTLTGARMCTHTHTRTQAGRFVLWGPHPISHPLHSHWGCGGGGNRFTLSHSDSIFWFQRLPFWGKEGQEYSRTCCPENTKHSKTNGVSLGYGNQLETFPLTKCGAIWASKENNGRVYDALRFPLKIHIHWHSWRERGEKRKKMGESSSL